MAGIKRKIIQDPLWYKDAIIYELHVRAFCDSNNDGIGDFPGLTSKLDYLEDLGVTALWLLPFYPSPLKDDGYDIADFYSVHPHYGTLNDFKEFLSQAHARGIRVITELVLNHTSDQHQWFQKSRCDVKGGKWRDFYVWNDDDQKYKDARIIFQDFETSNWTYDETARQYYWHRFYSHQPDLNFENPAVQKAVLEVLDFWAGLGVDGFRLDAIPYLFEQEGTNCENLPETYRFLEKLKSYMVERHPNRMFLAEANQWSEDTVLYFGGGKACDMAFNFPIMPRLYISLHMEDSFPLLDIMDSTPEVPDSCQWAIFLRNHDELTLEMVTDEERDYFYQVYAKDPQARVNLGIRRRLTPLLGNNRRKLELMHGLLFSLMGTPVMYYGDEIGMGDNIYLGDRNSVRTPMQWSPDRNAGFSKANPQKLFLPVITDPEYHFETVNVESGEHNLSSFLWWIKRLIRLRKRFSCFGRGSFRALSMDNRKILAFVREFKNERILAVFNLSRFVQHATLPLSDYKGFTPVELFGRNKFPAISDEPYFLTFAPHAFYWFSLELSRNELNDSGEGEPVLHIEEHWYEIFQNTQHAGFDVFLTENLNRFRWFGSKARDILSVNFIDVINVTKDENYDSRLCIFKVGFAQGESETYMLPVTFLPVEFSTDHHDNILSVVHKSGKISGYLMETFHDTTALEGLIKWAISKKHIETESGRIVFKMDSPLRRLARGTLNVKCIGLEQSNTSVIINEAYIFKFIRRIDKGVHPEEEMLLQLKEARFEHSPMLGGSVNWHNEKEISLFGVITEFLPHQSSAWVYVLNELQALIERNLPNLMHFKTSESLASVHDFIESDEMEQQLKSFDPVAAKIAVNTAKMHNALLASKDKHFTAEKFSLLYQKSIIQSLRNQVRHTFQSLEKQFGKLAVAQKREAREVLDSFSSILKQLDILKSEKISGLRIRVHGDYHLGQVLFTGQDFQIIDFEGEVTKTVSERRIKRSPLKDVAGMLRSFDYARWYVVSLERERGMLSDQTEEALFHLLKKWYKRVCDIFLSAYRDHIDPYLLPSKEEHFKSLLNYFLYEKAIYELSYELNHRPNWVHVPIKGLLSLIQASRD